MADIVINGTTYSNVTAIKVKNTAGQIITFELNQ